MLISTMICLAIIKELGSSVYRCSYCYGVVVMLEVMQSIHILQTYSLSTRNQRRDNQFQDT